LVVLGGDKMSHTPQPQLHNWPSYGEEGERASAGRSRYLGEGGTGQVPSPPPPLLLLCRRQVL
jgi:hypothetical protein